jgi:hypothetical protein
MATSRKALSSQGGEIETRTAHQLKGLFCSLQALTGFSESAESMGRTTRPRLQPGPSCLLPRDS